MTATVRPDPPPPEVTPVDSPPPASLLDKLVGDLLGNLIDRIPLKHKTLIGVLSLTAAWLCRAYLAPACPQYPWIATAADVLEYVLVPLTGIGVFHKAWKAGQRNAGG